MNHGTDTVKGFLIETMLDLFFPNCTASCLSAFTDKQISLREMISPHLFLREVHFLDFAEVKIPPLNIVICQIRFRIVPLTSLLAQHFS